MVVRTAVIAFSLLLLPVATACTDPDPTGLAGEWDLAWSCESRCDLQPAPPLAQSDVLEISGTDLHWNYAQWLVHSGTPDAGACLSVEGGNDWVVSRRDPYTLCLNENDTVTTAILEIGQAGAVQTRWSVVGTRR